MSAFIGLVLVVGMVVGLAYVASGVKMRMAARARVVAPVAVPPKRDSKVPSARRLVLTATLLTFACIGLYPPWTYTYSPADGAVTRKPAPRALILEPPTPELKHGRSGVVLDTSRLAVEWIVVAVLGAAVYVLTRRREP